MATINADMQQRRDTAANWTSADTVLKAGELGVETDTNRAKVGDGSTAWTSLPYLDAEAAADAADHIADAAGAHAGSAVSVDDTGLVVITGTTTVQAALAALDARSADSAAAGDFGGTDDGLIALDGAGGFEQVARGTYPAVAGIDAKGGRKLDKVRNPTFVTDRAWPRGVVTHRPLWVDGDTVYAVGLDKTVYKSTDAGDLWTKQGRSGVTLGSNGAFLKSQAGTLLSAGAATPHTIYRSTDDGATWTLVHTMRTGTVLLGPQSWCEDLTTNNLYLVEYDGSTSGTQTEVRVYRSTDDGATWSSWYAFDGQATGGADHIRHLHSCQYDPVSAKVYFLAGDNEDAAGIYRVDAAGTSIEKVVVNSETPDGTNARAIGLMWFDDYIAWGTDSPTNPYVCRMARTAIGSATSGDVEKVYGLNSSAWFTCQASADRSVWLVSASNEDTAEDEAAHLYAVENEGQDVYEVGSVEPRSGSAFASLSPVGQAEQHNEVVWLRGHNFGDDYAVRGRLARSTVALPSIQVAPRTMAWQTMSSGRLTVAAGSVDTFGFTRAPAIGGTLLIYDYGCLKDSGSGSLRLRVTNSSGTILGSINTSAPSGRMAGQQDLDEYLVALSIAANADTWFRLHESGGAASVTGSGFVTFGWAIP